MDEYEVLIRMLSMSLTEAKQLSARERENWIARAKRYISNG